MASPYDVLVSGDILGGVLQVYTDVMGFWVYTLGLMAILVMVYYKTKNITTVSVLGVLLGSAMITSGLLTAEGISVLQIIVILCVSGALYGAFKSVRD